MIKTSLLKVEHNILPIIELMQLLSADKILPCVDNDATTMTTAIDQPRYADFAKRLNQLMMQSDAPIKTVNDLKNVIGVSYEMARRYTLGTAKPRDEKLEKIAAAFAVSIGFLDHGEQSQELPKFDNNVSPYPMPKTKRVPLISWVQAGNWANKPMDEGEYQYVLSMFDTGSRGYALLVDGESMMPRYQHKDILFVNPDLPAEVGRRVIASCTNGTTFKELAMGDGGQMVLKALNEHWQPRYTPLEPDCHVLGVVVGSVRPE